MSRAHLINQLSSYKTDDFEEKGSALLIKDFIVREPRAFERQHDLVGHITASAFIVNPEFTHVLLNFHGIYNDWGGFGGHADGNEDAFAMARQEVEEETGLTCAKSDGEIFDVGVLHVSEHVRKGEVVPEHVHFDVVYLFIASLEAETVVSDESHDIKWFTFEEATKLVDKFDMIRRLDKVRALGDKVRLAA